MGKLLIINADDFGLDEDVNLGILEGHRAGLVRSASLMVTMPAAEAAADVARAQSELEVGLHINITEGRCLSPPHKLRPLVDDDGTFRFDTADVANSIRTLRRAIEEDSGLADRVVAEVLCQIERFRDLGLKLAHLNAHHYWPLIHPRLYTCYVKIAEQAGVPFRSLCQPMLDLLGTPVEHIAEMTETTRSARVPSPSVSLSNPLDATEDHIRSPEWHRSLIEEKLAEFSTQPEIGAVELITHPAMTGTREADVYAWARRVESALVHSEDFRRTVDRLGYVACGYSALSGNDH
jgi:predicted glycoside hydrolase/deacetylase ChbG (UPF0249 family)